MWNRTLRWMCVPLLALFGSGCAALVIGVAGGAAGTVYVKGQLKESLDHSVPDIREATKAGLKDMGLPLVKDQGDDLTASLKSGFSDGKDVWIDIKSVSKTVSEIRIRVGMVGDEQRSRQILDAIRRHL